MNRTFEVVILREELAIGAGNSMHLASSRHRLAHCSGQTPKEQQDDRPS
jgi:hypothetical protein